MNIQDSENTLQSRVDELEAQLEEAEETLRAIRSGEVDALIVSNGAEERVFTLQGADHPYRILIQEMQEGAATLDLDGAVLYSNAQFARILQTPPEKLIGSPIQRFMPASEADVFAAFLRAACRGSAHGELTLSTELGDEVPVHASLNLLNIDGMQSICAVFTDLTEQRRNAEIVAAEQLSRSILEQAAEAIVVIDGQGKILRASQAAQRLARHNVLLEHFDSAFPLVLPDKTLGQHAEAAEGVPTPVDAEHLLARCGTSEGIRGFEVMLRSAGREARSLLLTAGPLWTDRRVLAGCVVTLTDITSRKQVENALAAKARELLRLNGELQQFAYVTSHDLQEPLRTISNYAQLLKKRYDGQLDSDGKEFIDHVVNGTGRMKSVIDALLAYSHVVNTQSRQSVRVPMNMAVDWARMNLEVSIREAGAAIECGPLPVVNGDQVLIITLLQNLLGNAIKYRSQAPPVIQISAAQEAEECVFTVRDNGIGIAPEYHERIFGVFKRLHGKEVPGTGIGLAICKRIVEKQGGRIWVESEPGQGAAFRFTLPDLGAAQEA